MDKETIKTYDREAEKIAELHSTLMPNRIYELIDKYFIKCEKTADIGCGIGRDSYWLNKHGFPVVSIDASKEMLKQARILYPNLIFKEDFLPELSSLKNSLFKNILCSAVLMHLKNDEIKTACYRLFKLLEIDGRLIVSIRGTNENDKRENGKLYEEINIESFINFFIKHNCEILLYESEIEQKRQLTWHNFVIKK